MCVDLPVIVECGLHGVCGESSFISNLTERLDLTSECFCQEGWSTSTELVIYLDPSSRLFSRKVLINSQPLSSFLNFSEEELSGDDTGILSLSDLKALSHILPCETNKALVKTLNLVAFFFYFSSILLLLSQLKTWKMLRKQLLFFANFLTISLYFLTKGIDTDRNLAEDVFLTVLYSLGTTFGFISVAAFVSLTIDHHLKKLQDIHLFQLKTITSVKSGLMAIKVISAFAIVVFVGCLVVASILFTVKPESTPISMFSSLICAAYVAEAVKVIMFAFLTNRMLNKLISDMEEVNQAILFAEERKRNDPEYNPFSFSNRIEFTRQVTYQNHCARSVPGLKRLQLALTAYSGFVAVNLLSSIFFPFVQHLRKYTIPLVHILFLIIYFFTLVSLMFSAQGKLFSPLKMLKQKITFKAKSRMSLTQVASFGSSLTSSRKSRVKSTGKPNNKAIRRQKTKQTKRRTRRFNESSLKESFTEGMKYIEMERLERNKKQASLSPTETLEAETTGSQVLGSIDENSEEINRGETYESVEHQKSRYESFPSEDSISL